MFGNLILKRKRAYSPMRRIGLGTWDSPGDPTVYGTITLRMENVLAYIRQYKQCKRKPITVMQVLIKAVAEVLKENPDANSLVRYQRIYHRQQVGIFSQVFMRDPVTQELDLSGVTIIDAEKKSLEEIAGEFHARVKQVKKGQDEKFEQTRQLFRWLPFFLARPLLNLTAFLNYTFNLNLSLFGVPCDAFGSIMITNISSLGLEQAFVPLVPYSRVPMLISMGPVLDEPIVENGAIVIGKQMKLYVTFDHRLLDGSHAAAMSNVLKRCFAQPETYFGPIL